MLSELNPTTVWYILKIGAILIFEATSIRVVQISAISVPLIPKKLIINCVVTKRSNNFDVSNLFD